MDRGPRQRQREHCKHAQLGRIRLPSTSQNASADDIGSQVKADRGDNEDAQQTINELQKETAKVSQQNKEQEMKKAP